MWQCSICQPTLSADGWFPTDSGKQSRWTAPDCKGGYTACGEEGRQCAGVHMEQCRRERSNAEMAGPEDMQLDVQGTNHSTTSQQLMLLVAGEPVLITGKPMSQDLTRPSSAWSAYLPQLPDGASIIGVDGVLGLSYNNASHALSGIPTQPGQHNLTYYLKLSPRGMAEQTRLIVVDDGSTAKPIFELPGEILFDSGRRPVTAQTIYPRLPNTLGPYDCNGGGVVQIPGQWLYNIQAVIIGNGDNTIQLRPGEFTVDDRIYQSNVAGADGVSECANMLTFVAPPRDPPTAAQGTLGWSEGIFVSQTGRAAVLPTGWSLFYKDLSEATAKAAIAALAGVDPLHPLVSEFKEFTMRNRAHARNQAKIEAKEETTLQDSVDQLFERTSLDQSVVTFDLDLLDGLRNALQLAEEVAPKRPYFADDWALSAQAVINAIDSKAVQCDKTRLKQLKSEAQEIVRKVKEILQSSHFALVAADKVRTSLELFALWKEETPTHDMPEYYQQLRLALKEAASTVSSSKGETICMRGESKKKVLDFVQELRKPRHFVIRIDLLENADSSIRQYAVEAAGCLSYCALKDLKGTFDEMRTREKDCPGVTQAVDRVLEFYNATNELLGRVATGSKSIDLALTDRINSPEAR